jgi:RNA polymerase sigma factor (sigma-70 family)
MRAVAPAMIEAHRPFIHHLVMPLNLSRDDREDLVQDVLVKCLRSLHSFTGDESGLAAWIRSVTKSVAIDRVRRLQRRCREVPLAILEDF